jgi:phosphoribosyl-AMP cyclohydrolase
MREFQCSLRQDLVPDSSIKDRRDGYSVIRRNRRAWAMPQICVLRRAHESCPLFGLVAAAALGKLEPFGVLLPIVFARDLLKVVKPLDDLAFLSSLKWNEDGLIPAIVQDADNGEVLMMAWMDEPAVRDTIATGQTHFYSRSRRTHWHKGATSGHVQHVASIWLDCDGDVLLIKAHQTGGACHEGYRSCFFRRVAAAGDLEVASQPVFDAAKVYGSSPDA